MKDVRWVIRFAFVALITTAATATSIFDPLEFAKRGDAAMRAHTAALAQGDSELAQTELTNARDAFAEVSRWSMSINPSRIDSLEQALYYGEALTLARQYDLAARTYQRGFELDSSADKAALLAARNFRKTGPSFFEAATELFSSIPEDSDYAEEVAAEQGRIYHELKLMRQARTSYERALSSETKPIIAQLGLALIDISEGRVAQGGAVLDNLETLDELDATFINRELPNSLKRIEKRHLTIPSDAESQAAYAQLLARTGRTYEAIAAIEHALLLDKSRYVWYNLLGGLTFQQGMGDRSRAAYTRSLELNPDQPVTRQMLLRIPTAE